MKVLNSFEFRSPVGQSGPTYDWDTLLDGKIRKLEEGEDYHCKPSTFRMMISTQGRKRGVAVRVNKVDGGLVVQAYPATPEQKAKWEAAEKDEAAEEQDETPPAPKVEQPAPAPRRGKKGK